MDEIIDLIVLAAGKGTRMRNRVPKQFLLLGGKPILAHTLEVFERIPYIGQKIITCDPEHRSRMAELLTSHGISGALLVEGGATRQESVWKAVRAAKTDRVLTHNAVLPFVTPHLVNRITQENYDCVTTVTLVHESICSGEDFAEEILDRSRLRYINSPQCFDRMVLLACHEKARLEGYKAVSDCQLLMHYGHTIRFIQGPETNFKITTPKDLIVAEVILRNPEIRLEDGL